MSFSTHEQYLATVDAEARKRLALVQAEVERRVPAATRCISYNMPAFKEKRVFFYFAAFKKHIGIYPPITDDKALILETTRFRGPKGNLSFAHKEPLPVELIGKVAVALSAQYAPR